MIWYTVYIINLVNKTYKLKKQLPLDELILSLVKSIIVDSSINQKLYIKKKCHNNFIQS